MNYLIELILIAVSLSLTTLLVQKKIIDQEKAKEIKDKMKKLKNKITGSEKEENNVQKIQKELMNLQTKYMRMTMKASLPTMAVFILIYWLMGKRYSGYAVSLPTQLPVIGNNIGWIWIFIFFSLTSNIILRKILKIES